MLGSSKPEEDVAAGGVIALSDKEADDDMADWFLTCADGLDTSPEGAAAHAGPKREVPPVHVVSMLDVRKA